MIKLAYYPSGSIAVYMKIKALVEERFSDKRRKPYVSFNKIGRSNVNVIIRRGYSTTERTIGIEDADALNRLYDELKEL